jgi:hypothetical protein
MRRLVLWLSHPRTVLLLGTFLAVGTAVQLAWRSNQDAA